MIIKSSQAIEKIISQMKIEQYKINGNFSVDLIEINGDHGTIKCLNEDRIYFILDGEGKFILHGEESTVNYNDLIFVPKNTPYNIVGNLKYLLICSPAFKAEDDVIV